MVPKSGATSQPTGTQEFPYIFPSEVGNGRFTAAKSCLARLCATAKLEGVTPHTLHHSLGRVAGDLGSSELTICRAPRPCPPGGVTKGHVHIDEAFKLAATRTREEIASFLNTGLNDAAAGRKEAA